MKIIIALLIFGIIVFVHEFGHFLLAKANGIYVEEFSIGMGPKLFAFQKGETKYCIKLLPLGGSCMMRGEDEASDDERAFNNKSVWARFSVVFAGPLFNFIFAFLLAIVLIALIGADVPKIVSVEKDSPAEEVGLQAGDIITSYNGNHILVGREIYVNTYFHPIGKDPIDITYKRNGKTKKISVVPKKYSKYYLGMSYTNDSKPAVVTVTDKGALDEAGIKTDDVITGINGTAISSGNDFYKYVKDNKLTEKTVSVTYERNGKESTVEVKPQKNEYYATGFSYNANYKDCNEKVDILGVVKYSFNEVYYQVETVLVSLKQMVTGHVSADSIAGPVGIVDMVGSVYSQSAVYGALAVFESLASFCIMLSANLGIMNLLPLPALDGGRLLFMIVEMIRGKKVDPDKEGFVHFIGFVLLMILMVFVMFNDIKNIFIR